jgi:hypothetical protein
MSQMRPVFVANMNVMGDEPRDNKYENECKK